MSTAAVGVIAGMALALGGFGAFVLVAALEALGFLVGWFGVRGAAPASAPPAC
jgi:hypothetical protein